MLTRLQAEVARNGVPYKHDSLHKLSIIDPNNPLNDIAGGSANTRTILKCFSDCYNDLQKRMGQLQYSAGRRNRNILGRILGGNYESFRLQREHLAHIHEKLYGPVNAS
jgi:non-canonical poly(A) RNA polymerase PAPD5/7